MDCHLALSLGAIRAAHRLARAVARLHPEHAFERLAQETRHFAELAVALRVCVAEELVDARLEAVLPGAQLVTRLRAYWQSATLHEE